MSIKFVALNLLLILFFISLSQYLSANEKLDESANALAIQSKKSYHYLPEQIRDCLNILVANG